jgi:DNA-binding transcriptional ArsR family regulator
MKQLWHPSQSEITLTGVLGALSDPVRLSVVCRLSRGEEIGWGEFDVEVANSTLSHHIKILREAGVITCRKEGTRCFVSLREDVEETFPGLVASILEVARRDLGKV